MVVFLYHVCARLLESRQQVQALTRIQVWYRYRRWVSLWRQKRDAARAIWKHWVEHKDSYYQTRCKKYRPSIRIIETFVARNFDNLLLLKERRLERELQGFAATTIQVRSNREALDVHVICTHVLTHFATFNVYGAVTNAWVPRS